MIRAQMDGEDAVLETDNIFSSVLPNEFALNQNYPNPFNLSTSKIWFKREGNHDFEVFNILGESVSKVVNESLDAGFYNYRLDMSGYASGMYFYKLTAVNENGTQLYNEMKDDFTAIRVCNDPIQAAHFNYYSF